VFKSGKAFVTRLSPAYLNNFWSLTLVPHIDGKLFASAVYMCTLLQDQDLYFREISRIKQRYSLLSSKVFQP